MRDLYAGPIVDAHVHLWSYRKGKIPWVDGSAQSLARTFAYDDYEAAAERLTVEGAVWIEAQAVDPVAECREATALAGPLPLAIVAHAPLDAPDLEAKLDALATAAQNLRGVRDIVAAVPGQPSFARRPDLLMHDAFLNGLHALQRRGLVFDLMLEPAQMADAMALAAAAPDLAIVIEHAGNPDLSTAAGVRLWRDAMAQAAERPNVAIKLSALHCRMPDWTDERLAEAINWAIQCFGVDRVAFASDFPAHDRNVPMARSYLTFARAVAGLSAAEQRALFCENARRFYRL
jgi:predicted TIM-barrel fold metal-dependent hydrolase